MLNELKSSASSQYARLYGLYSHNLSKVDARVIGLRTVENFLKEVSPFKYEYGDVLVLEEDNEIGEIIGEVVTKMGYVIDFIAPNQLYRLMDRLVMHYIFTDEYITQKQSESFVHDWEISMGLDKSDLRYTRYIKTFFINKT